MQDTATTFKDLSPQEIKLIQLIRSEKYQSIQIKFREGQPASVELKQIHAVNRRVVDLLQDDPFQTIILKTHRGRITHLESTRKEQLS